MQFSRLLILISFFHNIFSLLKCNKLTFAFFFLNKQMLEFRVFNIAKGTQPLKGRLPLTPGSQLTWFGFSEEGQLSSYDSKV